MEIKRLNINNIEEVKKCDELFKIFLNSEKKYDSNAIERNGIKSFLTDLEDEDKLLYATIEKNNVLGFLYGYICKNKSEIAEVAHLAFVYVSENSRNKKIATKMIEKFIKDMRDKSISYIDVKVYDKNEVAKKLYKKFGFEVLWSNLRKIN